MTTNYEPQIPPPTPLCAIFEPLLSLYCWQELDTTQMGSVQQHVAGCDYCRMQLEQYEAAITALRAHLVWGEQRSENVVQWNMDKPGTERAVRLTLDDITRADRVRASATRSESPTRARAISRRQERPSIFGPLAAVLVLAILSASLFTYLSARGPTPGARPTATRALDEQSLSYVEMLETYYTPLAQNFNQDSNCTQNDQADRQRIAMPSCQALEATIIKQVRTFDDHLTLHVPEPWQTADGQFKQANQAMITSFTAAVHASDFSAWQATLIPDQFADNLYCAPVKQINGDLLKAGIPIADLLPLPETVDVYPGCS